MSPTREHPAKRHAHRILWMWVGLLWVTNVTAQSVVPSIEKSWRVDPRLFLSSSLSYRENHGRSTSWHTLAATAELRVRSRGRPYYVSLFADYRFSFDDRVIDNVSLGALFRYNWHWWDATTYAFAHKAGGSAERWYYAGRLRYRLSEEHKVGMEAVGAFDNAFSPRLQLGYYGDLSDSLSLNVFAEPGWNHDADFAARVELSWTVR